MLIKETGLLTSEGQKGFQNKFESVLTNISKIREYIRKIECEFHVKKVKFFFNNQEDTKKVLDDLFEQIYAK